MAGKFLIITILIFIAAGCANEEHDIPVITHDYSKDRPKLTRQYIAPKPPVETATNVPKSWIPLASLEDKSRWKNILIHHSGSSYGCASHEDKYHRDLGWEGLGYDFVINNGVYKHGYGKSDGLVEVGYRWVGQKTGSHCRVSGDNTNYWNEHAIGICLIGDFEESRPTERQMRSLAKLCDFLQNRYNIPNSRIKGHGDVKPTKCPGKYFSFTDLRRRVGK